MAESNEPEKPNEEQKPRFTYQQLKNFAEIQRQTFIETGGPHRTPNLVQRIRNLDTRIDEYQKYIDQGLGNEYPPEEQEKPQGN